VRSVCIAAIVLAIGTAAAAQAAEQPLLAQGSVQVAFTPGAAADAMIIDAIGRARHQVLVLAFSFTHRRIADALSAAHRRGVEVGVIADRDQGIRHSRRVLDAMVASGVPVLLDAAHDSAHNKVIVIDPDDEECAVVTGSYNFSYAAQHRNAENVLLLRGNPALCDAYAKEWRRHAPHSRAHRPSR